MGKQLKGTAMLLLAAMVWGAAFVAQSAGMDLVGPFTFQAIRQFIACLALLPVILLRDKAGADVNKPKNREENLRLWKSGAICGTLLFLACTFQQFGLLDTTPGKSGFLTALYVIMVPISGIFLKKALGINIWASVILALVGLYFLCMDGAIALGKGEILTLICAVLFTCHILYLSKVSHNLDGVRLACLQFLFCGLISLPFMFLTEKVVVKDVLNCWLPILYTGAISSGVGYTLQILAQKDTDPTLASIAMSMESVFAVLFGWLLMGDSLGGREILGCVLMFSAIILAQLPSVKTKKEAVGF